MFDFEKFDNAQFTFVSKKIKVPELKSFFDENEKPEWEIRGLTGHELAIVNEAAETASKTRAIIEAVGAGTPEAIKKGLQTMLNKNDEATPEDMARRHKMLEFGSVPACPEHIAVKLSHNKPTVFYRLTNEIIRLTGDGASLGE